ncbi:MAG: nucleotidyltransferase family protein, partial [Clostridiales Family XIII bacterium]|nr:nucleotidyltransferase family protein [Clostridiales Family XIII bacterium]
MSRTLGIIAEYNPFHNGHLYHLKTSALKSGADAIVCVMSGDFVQRGEPAILDKWIRAKMAVDHGADLVIELPFLYACNNAEWFARGAVRILNGLGCIDVLSFGSEGGDLAVLKRTAEIITGDSEFEAQIKAKMQEGISYPSARYEALKAVAEKQHAQVLKSPNDTLAVEYLKQMLLTNSAMQPMAIRRVHDTPEEEDSNLRPNTNSAMEPMAVRRVHDTPGAEDSNLRQNTNSARKPMAVQRLN